MITCVVKLCVPRHIFSCPLVTWYIILDYIPKRAKQNMKEFNQVSITLSSHLLWPDFISTQNHINFNLVQSYFINQLY